MKIKKNASLVSLGMPVFNEEQNIIKALNSILNQSYENFELIISDNCSTDKTSQICKNFALKDNRIKYFRQKENLGPARNFKFVFDKAKGKYFSWVAADDIRSKSFLYENIIFLENNKNYAASSTPNSFDKKPNEIIDFEITGAIEDRVNLFFSYCWQSHSIFYSVFRKALMRDCNIIGESFAAVDWAINLHLLRKGNFNRTSKGLIIFGTKGLSNSADPWSPFRNRPIEFFFPLFLFSKFTCKEIKSFSNINKLTIYLCLIRLNLAASYFIFRGLFFKKINNFFA